MANNTNDKLFDIGLGRLSDRKKPAQKSRKAVDVWQIQAMGVSLIGLALLLTYLFLILWPAELPEGAKGDTATPVYLLGSRIVFSIPLDVRLILVVMVAGGLGSFIHAATSFGDYVGNNALASSWIWWYILRPFIGMMLAVVFYLALRGGFLSGGIEAGDINSFGITALAGLVGMFSKQATDKLNEIFKTLFKTDPDEGDAKRKDNLANPVPSINDIEPKLIEPKTGTLTVLVKGTGFVSGSAVRINGISRETEFRNSSQLIAKLLPDDIAEQGELEITVFNPEPGGGVSTPIKLSIAQKAPEQQLSN
ncbi:MAG TPA: IPT/TIG domain-containing protein [Anaerolineae bacterium]|nr:IPT/TIG domain-containing protein [Anaerolineae bacterium]